MKKKFTITGIDPSTKRLAFVTTDQNDDVFRMVTHQIERQGRPEVSAGASIITQTYVEQLAEWYPGSKHYFFLEEPVLGRGGPGSTIPQAMVSGAIQATLMRMETTQHLSLVNNKIWKREVCGTSRLEKEDIARWAEENWTELFIASQFKSATGLDRIDQDLIDAGCINRYGLMAVQRETRALRILVRKKGS